MTLALCPLPCDYFLAPLCGELEETGRRCEGNEEETRGTYRLARMDMVSSPRQALAPPPSPAEHEASDSDRLPTLQCSSESRYV